MNKKEQAEMDGLRNQLRIAKALRFTEAVGPDVPIPSRAAPHAELSKGWLYHQWHGEFRVEIACSSVVNHAVGRNDRTTTQQPRELYSSKLRALRDCRAAMEMDFAKALARVDAEIEAEAAKAVTP